MQIRIGTLLLGFSFSLLSGSMALAETEAKPTAPSEKAATAKEAPAYFVGTWNNAKKAISVKISDGTVEEGLKEVAKEAGWGLVISAPERLLDRKITLNVSKKAVKDAIQEVLRAGDLQAELDDNLLTIRPLLQEDENESERAEVIVGDLQLKVRSSGKHSIIHDHDEDDRVSVGRSVRIKAGETVDNAVSVGGSVDVHGRVNDDAVAVGGSVRLHPGSHVDGDAVAIGGKVDVKPGATLEGDQVSLSGTIGGIVSSVAGAVLRHRRDRGRDHDWNLAGGLWSVSFPFFRALALFVFGLLFLTFMPKRMETMQGFLEAKPGVSTAGGLTLLFGFVPVLILLVMTLVGILLIPVAVILFVAIGLMGLVIFATWLGQRMPLLGDRKTTVSALALGVAVLFLVDLIPWIGTPLILIAAVVSAGAVLLSRLGTKPGTPSEPALPATGTEG